MEAKGLMSLFKGKESKRFTITKVSLHVLSVGSPTKENACLVRMLVFVLVFCEGIKVDPKKTEAVKNWPRPLSSSDIRSFLGLACYYRRFVEGFASISSSLTKLTQKKTKYQWSEACQKSFQELKDRLTSAHILTLPEGDDGFVVYCDA